MMSQLNPTPDRIEADYIVETSVDPRRAVDVMAGEQSSGTFVAIPGETGTAGQVRAMSEALGELGGEIAAALRHAKP